MDGPGLSCIVAPDVNISQFRGTFIFILFAKCRPRDETTAVRNEQCKLLPACTSCVGDVDRYVSVFKGPF